MKNKEFVRILEKRGIETVDQLIDAIEAGSKVAKINLKIYEDKIEGLMLLIAVEQQKVQKTKSLLAEGKRTLEMLRDIL